MSEILIPGGASGAGSDDCTATAADVIKGKTAVVSGSDDEPIAGTLDLSGNATTAYVYTGKTFYNTDPKAKLTGAMTVNSLLSFSVAAYSGRRVLAKWQNPKAATGKPYSGVYIRYSTSGNPGKTGGTQIYKGAGNNTASGGQSQAYLNLPALSTKYYLSIYPYVTCSAGEMNGSTLNASVTTSAVLNKTFTASTSYTIPVGFAKMDLFAVGGGSAGSSSNNNERGGSGGGGGYTKTVKGIAISSGQVLTISVGSGGVGSTGYKKDSFTSKFIGGVGGTSSVTRSGTELISAVGGTNNSADGKIAGGPEYGKSGGSGGGGGSSVKVDNEDAVYNGLYGGGGGSDGSDGKPTTYGYSWGTVATGRAGLGQKVTTSAFGESSGALYGSGGGGCIATYNYREDSIWIGNNKGGPGAGEGGTLYYSTPSEHSKGKNANANSGGGGGGGAYLKVGGNGGSGIVLIRLY